LYINANYEEKYAGCIPRIQVEDKEIGMKKNFPPKR
jgi:hypothetical protein